MMPAVRLRISVLVLAALLPVGVAAGCGGDPKPATGPGLPSQADLKSYFEAITGGDLDEMTRVAGDIAAEGSLAQAYASYDAEFAVAAASAGEPDQAADVEEVDGGFKACLGDSDQCATWTDLEGKDGKLADFDINGIELGDLMVDLTARRRSSPPVSTWSSRATPTASRRAASSSWSHRDRRRRHGRAQAGDLHRGGPHLRGGQGPGPVVVNAGKSSPIVLAFEDAKDAELDGQITFDLKIAGAATESIGFGLTARRPSCPQPVTPRSRSHSSISRFRSGAPRSANPRCAAAYSCLPSGVSMRTGSWPRSERS